MKFLVKQLFHLSLLDIHIGLILWKVWLAKNIPSRYNNTWSWHDNPFSEAGTLFVMSKFRVCLTSTPLIFEVFSNFFKFKKSCLLLQIVKQMCNKIIIEFGFLHYIMTGKKLLLSTYSLAKLLLDSSISQSHSKL